ncbi:UPF0014-domain-containing protein [Ramaria rubella]|nr:UPF0014-domain-containing protein [Ramaria rubella]
MDAPESSNNLGWSSLALAFSFIAFDAFISLIFGLKIGTSLVTAAIRCVVQLSLMALVLKSVFQTNNPWAVAGIACLLNILGAFETVVNRSSKRYSHMFPTVLLAMMTSTIPISLITTRFIMSADPFWKPEQYIPIVGMLAGSTISGMVVALMAVLREVHENRDKIETYLAFGASRIEASIPIAQQALLLALTPVVNQMSVIGIISIPGMMTGALLGGSSVEQAAKLQMVIMFSISASTALGSIVATVFCLAVVIDREHRLRDDKIDPREHAVWRMRDKIGNAVSTYGRRRESIVDIEEQIIDIFTNHPQAHFNDSDTPVIPAQSLPEVLLELSARYGVDVLDKDEEQKVAEFVQDNPGIEVTPELLLGFIAQVTAKNGEGRSSQNSSPELEQDDSDRGRHEDRHYHSRGGSGSDSRSSSTDSNSTSVWRRAPRTPGSRGPDSPFEAKSRQRSAPLAGPPSSWTKRPAPAHRRKSDAGSRRGSMSDNEVCPTGFYSSPQTRDGPRARAPSTPSSPITYSPESYSPPLPGRPHSRAHSHSNFSLDHAVRRFGSHSPQSDNVRSGNGMVSPPPDRDDEFSPSGSSRAEDMSESISSLPMPGSHDSDSDGDSDDDETHRMSMGLILDHDRSVASSIASLAPQDRVEALQKNNQDLARRLMEAERSLQNRLADHEVEIEEMQSKLDDIKSELTATKREEKELRNKERQNIQQIQVLESELAKLQKTLDSSRALYQNLQKQYAEQCAESEKYRNSLRRKDQETKELEDSAQLHQIEVQKWNHQREALEAAHSITEQELAIARQAQTELEDQKQENLVLKETIDRLRFDLDELRTREHAASGGASAATSQFGSVSKSLGAELMNRWEALGQEDEEEEDVGDEDEEGSGTDGEEMIQTIITRKKRRVGGAGKREVLEITETKEFSDAYTQHDASEFATSFAIQTEPEPKPSTAVSSMQTDPEPEPLLRSFETQTDPEPKPRLASSEVQTDPELTPLHPEALSPPDEDDELASSSSTVRPSTPKPSPPRDAPPSYDQTLSRQALARALEGFTLDYSQVKEPMRYELKVAEATLKQWHKGASLPFEPLPEGISTEAVEQWAKLKKELGAECMVLDKIIAASKKVPATPAVPKKSSNRRRFYNIYNTYFYNKTDSALSSYATPVFVGFVFSTVMFLALSPASPYAVPGMPTYQDRAYWTAFHALDATGEGFAGGQSDALWTVVGRLLLGSADIVRRANMPS